MINNYGKPTDNVLLSMSGRRRVAKVARASGCMRKTCRHIRKNGSAAICCPRHCYNQPRIAREGEPDCDASHFVIDALFTTITNANFYNDSLDGFIRKAFELKNILAGTAKETRNELARPPASGIFSPHQTRPTNVNHSPVSLPNRTRIYTRAETTCDIWLQRGCRLTPARRESRI